MRAATRILCVLGGVLAVTGSATVSQAAGAATKSVVKQRASFFPTNYELTELLQMLVQQGEAKGIVIGLLEPDGRRRIISYGDAGAGTRALSSKTVFELGSINKTFTSAVLADMVRRGEVSLDDPVAKYLPADVKVPSRGGRQITLVDLATHTSGLPRVPTGYKIPDRANPYAHYEAKHLYEFLSTYELERDIGAEPIYSNLGAGLLGHALARAAGVETLGQLIHRRITRPLKMKMTDYGRAGELGTWMARGHKEKGEEVPYWDVAVLAGAGGLNSNVEDMLSYLAANTGTPKSQLEAAMRDAHQPRRKLKTEGFSVGLGWQQRTRQGQTIVNHGGGTGGFQTHIGFDPATGAGVVILGNSAGFETRDDIVFQLLRGKRFITLPASSLAQYTGSYRLSADTELTITLEQGKLFAQRRGQPKARLYAEAQDRFILLSSDAEVSFSRDQTGAVTGASMSAAGKTLIGSKSHSAG